MRRNNIRHRSMTAAAMVVAVCISMTGCGGEYTGVSRGVSDSAVSGGAVSGGALKSRDDSKSEDKNATDKQQTAKNEADKYPFRTDTNMYYEDYNKKDECCIVQARLDGTRKEIIVNSGDVMDCYLHYVDENWLYYEIEQEEEDKNILYRIPIKKDAGGYDVVKKSDQEELLQEGILYNPYWDSDYAFFDNGEDKIIRYDLQNKKRVSEWKYEDFKIDEYDDSELEIFRLQNCYVAVTEGGGVYVLKPDGTEWKKCQDGGYDLDGAIVQTENSVFYVEDTSVEDLDDETRHIWKCDGKTVQSFITQEQMNQAAKRAKEMDAEDSVEQCLLSDLYTYDGRLYIELEIGWNDDTDYRAEYLLFSQGEDETELRYEKELTECMQSHVKSRTGKWIKYRWDDGDDGYEERVETVYKEHVIANDAQCVTILNGNVYLSLYDYEKDKGRMGCYELSTGKFRWVTKKEVLYGELAWTYVNCGFSDVFYKGKNNEFVDFEADGEFHENKK